MGTSSATFDELWTRAGLHGATIQPDQTIRRDPTGTITGSLPHLTIGDATEEELPDGPDLVLHARLGEGGMGVVWLARQASLGRDVAIKQVKPEAPRHATDALLREARFMGQLEHPNIVPVHVLGVDDRGRPSLVMKRVEGVPWRTLIRDEAHPWWQADPDFDGDRLHRHVEILADVCRAVAYAHDRGVLHRDLKPENVMVGGFGEVWLMDWGVATALDGPDRGGIVGTPAYMAPEMLDPAAPLDARTDVYLLGACLHEALTGEPPHRGDGIEAIFRAAHASEPASYDDVPPELAAIANRARARRPEDRFASATELQRALTRYLRHRSALAIAAAASARLDALRALLAAEHPDPARVDELFTECRFGFRQAVEADAGNDDAERGLRDLFAAMVPYKLTTGDVDGAEALLAQLPDPGPLVDRVAGARAEQARVRQMVSDLDPTRGWRERRVFGLAIVALFGAVTVAVFSGATGGMDAYDHDEAVRLVVISLVAMIAIVIGGHRWLLATAVNRRVAALVTSAGFAMLLNRLLARELGTPIPAMLASDLIIGSGMAMAGALAVAPRIAWIALPYAIGAVVIGVWPEHALTAFGVTGVTGAATLAAVFWRGLR